MSLEQHLLALAPSRSILLASCLPWHLPHSFITVLFCPTVGPETQIPVTKNWSLWNCALKEVVLLVFVLFGCLANTKKSNSERNEQLVEVIRGLGWGVFVFLQIHCKAWESKGKMSRAQSKTGRLHGRRAPLRLSHSLEPQHPLDLFPLRKALDSKCPSRCFFQSHEVGETLHSEGIPAWLVV